MKRATIVVRGTGVAATEPDEAELWLQLDEVRAAPDEALGEVARRARIVDGLLDELLIPRNRRSTMGVTVAEEREHDPLTGRSHLIGFRAQVRTRVRIEDAEAIGTLLAEAARRAQATAQGPSWIIVAGNPARLEACRLAVADARRKAEAYADALGGRLGPVVAVTEPAVASPRHMALQSRAAMQPMAQELDIEAGELQVIALVDVSFVLDQDTPAL